MSSYALAGYGALALIGVVLSALFSGAETGVYTLNRVRLAVRAARGERAAVRLRAEMADQNRLLAMLLVGTNTSSYLASYALAAILHHEYGLDDWTLIAVEVAIFTPLLFVFAETLPKDLFRTHTDDWTYRLAGVLRGARWVFVACGLLPIVKVAGALISRLLGGTPEGAASARQHISQLIKEGVGVGVLSESQTTIADRALAMRGRTVGSEMIPWSRVLRLPIDAGHSAREALVRDRNITRVPVVDGEGRAVGILSLLDALLEPEKPTAQLMREPLTFPPEAPVRDALRSMRSRRYAMAIIADAPGSRPLGMVTLKDLVEPITGELAAW